MNTIPNSFLKYNRTSTTYKLYDNVSSLLNCKKHQIQIYYKDIKIPYTKSNLNEIEIPKIGYEYGDCFKFQRLQDKIPPLIEIMYKNNKKTLKLSNTTLSKNIEKTDIIYVVSKLLHTSSQNINFLEDKNFFSLKKGSLYEIDFIDFNKHSRETEYYCFDESRKLMDLQAFVANMHGLHSNQIKYVEYEDNKDQSRVLNSFPSEKIFCFTTLESKGSSKDSDINNKAYKLSVDVSIDGSTVNFELPFDSKIKDLRKEITKHSGKNYFGIYIEKEFVSDEKRITRFLIEPNKVNKVYTIYPEEEKRCGLFLFQNKEKNHSNNKDILYLMNLNMNCREVQQFFFKKNYSKEFIDTDDKVIDPNCTLANITSKNESMKVIKYQNSLTKYFYEIEDEGEIHSVEIAPTKRIIDFLNQIDIINKIQPENNEYIVVNYQGAIAPFWNVLLLYQTTKGNCFQIKKYKKDKIPTYKIVNDKLEDCKLTYQAKYKLYSSFIEVPKNQIQLYFPFKSCFTIREKKSRPMIITFVRSPCLKYECRIISKEDKKKSTAFEQIERFGLLDDNFQLKYKYGAEEYIIPPNFSIKSLPSKAEIQIEAETDKNCYAQLFYYDDPKKGHFISYDKTTTIKEIKEMLQKEFNLYEHPSDAISFYFYENQINEINGENQILKEFFISNCINPKTLIKVKINENIYGLKDVQIKIRKKEQSYKFKKNDIIEDVRKRIENQYRVQIKGIKEKGASKNLKDSDKIPDSLRIMFKKAEIMIPKSSNGKKFEEIMKAGAVIKSLIKNTKIAENYKYKFNPKYEYKIFVPRTSMYIHNKQTLTQLPKYEIFRYFTVKLKCDYLGNYQVNKLYNENLTVGDVYKDLRPLVKNDQYELYLFGIPKQNYNKKLGQMMENKKEIEARIIEIDRIRRKSISNKSFGLDDFKSFLNADSNEGKQDYSNEEVVNIKEANLDDKDSNENNEESLNKKDSYNSESDKTKSDKSESDKTKSDKSESDKTKPNKSESDVNRKRTVSKRKYIPKIKNEEPDDNDSFNKRKNSSKPTKKTSVESDSNKSDSDKNDSDKSDSDENSNSNESSSDEPKSSLRSPKKRSEVASDSTESESEGRDSDSIKEKNKKQKGKKELSDKKSQKNKKAVKSDSDNSSNSDDDDDNDDDDEVEKKYNFLFSKTKIISLPLPKGSTISDAKKKIAEHLNKNKENKDDDDVDPSAIDIVFSGKSLKRKTKLESMKLDENEVLNVYVQKVEDILLMTAKALRFTREDLDKDDDDEYEYVYDEEEEEEDDDDDDE